VSVRVFKSRASAQVEEDMSSFGQILAVFLLVSPIVTTIAALWPLRAAFLKLWESRAPPPGGRCLAGCSLQSVLTFFPVGLRHVDTLPAAKPSAAEVYRQFSDNPTSYDRPGTTFITSGACFIIVWATGLFFRDMVASDSAGGFTSLLNVTFLAFGQPIYCAFAYAMLLLHTGVSSGSQEIPDPGPEATGSLASVAADQMTGSTATPENSWLPSKVFLQLHLAMGFPFISYLLVSSFAMLDLRSYGYFIMSYFPLSAFALFFILFIFSYVWRRRSSELVAGL
jgi:hypothetical protein